MKREIIAAKMLFLSRMRTIEITTTQNVTIEYELASLRERVFAYFIDMIVIWVGILILNTIAGLAFDRGTYKYVAFLIIIPVFFFYTLVMEVINDGQSVGKMAMKIKVVKLNGRQATMTDYLMRWAFRMIDIYFSSGALAALFVNSTSKSQRLGDMLADTSVIRLHPQNDLKLKDILTINTLSNYQPRYPEVVRLKEADMLVVKAVLERAKLYRNKAHNNAMDELAEKISDLLNLGPVPNDRMVFLRTLLNDYVVLTRS